MKHIGLFLCLVATVFFATISFAGPESAAPVDAKNLAISSRWNWRMRGFRFASESQDTLFLRALLIVTTADGHAPGGLRRS
jgi:hypothetical protein